MGRAENWPDPRSRKWKIGDIRSDSIYANISSSKFQIIPTTTVPTAQSWSRSRGAHLSLTWLGDLTFWPRKSKFAPKVCYWSMCKYAKCGGAARRRFQVIPENRWGAESPPSGARDIAHQKISRPHYIACIVYSKKIEILQRAFQCQ